VTKKRQVTHDDDFDFDPEPIYLDDEDDDVEETPRLKEDILPSQRGKRIGDDIEVAFGDDLKFGSGDGDELSGKHWYVIHCYSGQENKVCHAIEQRIETMGMQDKIFDVVVPTEEEIEVKEGKRRTVERRVFPGYILVQMVMDEDSWYVVRNTPGVTGFVGMGNDPTPLRPEEVAQIMRRMEADTPKVKVTYKPGQKVRIIDGPFNEFVGIVNDIDQEKSKVRVMVSFFGRDTPVELDFLQVEKV
jgi:transcriptional antiterminator NusG